MNVSEFRKQYRYGPYVWPGGYPRFAITSDSGVLCFDCLKSERRNILESTAHGRREDEWRVEDFDVNYEDPKLFCDHCSARIESAYAEDCVTGECDEDCKLCGKNEEKEETT